jgi:hypothetical protein
MGAIARRITDATRGQHYRSCGIAHGGCHPYHRRDVGIWPEAADPGCSAHLSLSSGQHLLLLSLTEFLHPQCDDRPALRLCTLHSPLHASRRKPTSGQRFFLRRSACENLPLECGRVAAPIDLQPAAGCAIIAFATQSRWLQSDGRT